MSVKFKALLTFIFAAATAAPALSVSELPEVKISYAPRPVEVTAFKPHVAVPGYNAEVASVLELSDENLARVRGIAGGAFTSELDVWQLSRVVGALQSELRASGCSLAKAVPEADMQRGKYSVMLTGMESCVKAPKNFDMAKSAAAVEHAAKKRPVTSAGAAVRNLKAQDEAAESAVAPAAVAVAPSAIFEDADLSQKTSAAVPAAQDQSAQQGDEQDKRDVRDALAQASAATADTEGRLASMVSDYGSKLKGYMDADDRKAFLTGMANSYLGGMLDSELNEALNSFSGFHAEVSLGLEELKRLRPSGKLMIPLHNVPLDFQYIQTGLTYSSGERTIWHAGFGSRWFPDAASMTEPGGYMLGVNAVADIDLTRPHRRLSLGSEFATERFSASFNYYKRLSGWKASRDFESAFVQERPADGFDLRTKWFLPANYTNGLGALALTADIAHWHGKKVSPFGAADVDSLEDSPWIYSFGAEWQIMPAIAVAAKHEISDGGHHNSLVEVKFNIPLDDYSLSHAFDPHYASLTSGFDLNSARYAFINRDYSMPLQYRSTPGMWRIIFIGPAGDREYVFEIRDGFNKVAPGVPAAVEPKDLCVRLSQDGHYVSGADGRFTVKVLESCVTKTKVTVTAGEVKQDFEIDIGKTDLSIAAKPASISRIATSLITFKATAYSAGLPLTWSLTGAGRLSSTQTALDSNGQAVAVYVPDPNQAQETTVKVNVSYLGAALSAPVKVTVYGAGGDDFCNGKKEDAVEGLTVYPITWKNLEPGTEVTMTVTGDALLSLTKDGTGAASVIAKADDSGLAVAYALCGDVENGETTVTAETPDKVLGAKSIKIRIGSYVAKMSGPDLVEPGDDFTVKLTGLKPGTEVSWTDADHAAAKSKTSPVASDGTSEMVYTSAADYYKGSITGIEATYYRNVGATATVTLAAITVKEFTLSLSGFPDGFSGNDTFTVTLSGGKPGQGVTWSAANVQLSDEQAVFDADGKATATVTGVAPYSGEASVTAVAMGQTFTQSANGGYAKWNPAISLDGETEYLTAQSVKLTGLQPNSEVVLSAVSDGTGTDPYAARTPRFSLISTAYADGEGSVVFENAKVTAGTEASAGEGASAQGVIEGISDFTVSKYTVTAVCHVNSAETVTLTASSKMREHKLVMSAAKASLDAYAGNAATLDSTVVTVTGGLAGQKVKWNVTSDGTLENAQDVFDADGKATATLKSKAPFTAAPQVTLTGMARKVEHSEPYQLTEYKPTVNLPTYTSSLYGNTADQIDVDTPYTVTVSGLLPGSKVTMNAPVADKEATVADNGTATFDNLPAVGAADNYQTKSLTPTFTYIQKGAATAQVAKALSVHQYSLNMTTDKTEIYGDETFTATVTGGKPGAAVDWSLTGSGKYTAKAATFDANGKATATVQGIDPFTISINPYAACVGKRITANPVNYILYKITIDGLENYQCNGSLLSFQPKIKTVNIPGWIAVKSAKVSLIGKCDDTCELYLNDTRTPTNNTGRMVYIRAAAGYYYAEYGFNGTFPFSMTDSELQLKAGANNTRPNLCFAEDLKFTVELRNY